MVRVHARDSLPRGACVGIHDRFEVFVGALERCYGISLRRPRFGSEGDIKSFCTGLIEGQSNHPWRHDLQRQRSSIRTRMSVAHSLFLFRKLIPNERPQVVQYAERMSVPGEAADVRFLAFCRQEIRRMFHIGWDRRYQDACTTSVLPITSCYENGRSMGGARGLVEQGRIDREEFCSYISESVAPRHRGPSRVEAVLAGDKWRVVSIPPVWDNALRPFHQCLYDFVSKQEWCLRGDAVPHRFKGFHKNGEIFVSGDYESATDNLNSEVQRTILLELILQSRSIPRGIRLHALSTFSSELEAEGDVFVQARGQLMGQLLSFPLLCLVNYLTFKYCIPRDVPVRINGDDIVFRAREEEVHRWQENVGRSGLKLSHGKTMVNRRFFTLNSSIFEATVGSVRQVPFVRPKALWGSGERECERVASLAPRFRSYAVGYGRRRRGMFDTVFLKENLQTVLRCRRSLTRGMGMRVSEETLRDSGLWHRELFYLEQVVEPPLPPMSFSELRCNDLPHGWVKVSPHWYGGDPGGAFVAGGCMCTQGESHPPGCPCACHGWLARRDRPYLRRTRRKQSEIVRGWAFRLSLLMVRSAWTRSVIKDSEAEQKWMSQLDEGAVPWGMKHFGAFKGRLLRMSRRQLWRWRCLRGNRALFGRVRWSRGEGVWMPGTPPLNRVGCDNDDGVEGPDPLAYLDRCPVCLEGAAAVLTDCDHGFCHGCLREWLAVPSRGCPLCRRKVSSQRGLLSKVPIPEVLVEGTTVYMRREGYDEGFWD